MKKAFEVDVKEQKNDRPEYGEYGGFCSSTEPGCVTYTVIAFVVLTPYALVCLACLKYLGWWF